MCFKTIMSFPTPLSIMNVLQKLLFHGQEYRRAAAPAGPLSYCFGITLLLERTLLPFELLEAGGKPSTWFPPGGLFEPTPCPNLKDFKYHVERT